ncbi:TKL family protein kinase [Tritrichomonas foetus]|uniref:TKL family protein kinase n=1 Tax=Tritrichomonas foetus TaxID=1144522 RepID=A0A1J4K472_9EUKA|nr:TKL family protein kinase [Tritrichomonas foetus]|eukprot:OHT04494.1 TKL family protein kinase [Tritrichomonas foetus]
MSKEETKANETNIFMRKLKNLESLTDQTAVHRKKFEFALAQLRKFAKNYNKIQEDSDFSPEQKVAINSILQIFQELKDIIAQNLLQNWTSPTIDNSSDTVLVLLKNIFSRFKENAIILSPSLADPIDPDSNQWDQYHLLDLRAIRASFTQYLKSDNSDPHLRRSIQARLQSIDNQIETKSEADKQDVVVGMRTFSPIPINYRNWKVSITDFEKKNPVGTGVSATVYYSLDKRTGQEVAIKEFRFLKMNGNKLQSFQREVAALATAIHPSVLGLIGATETPPFCIITEWMPNGSLYHDLHDNNRLDATGRTIAAFDIARGMQYLHSIHIAHRDLKSLNILLDSNNRIRICDFGFSRHAASDSRMTSGIGTPHWMAPEILTTEHNYTSKVDVYAYGVVLWELATKLTPYHGMYTRLIISEVKNKDIRPQLPNDINPALKDLITQCWDRDPDVRPSFDEIVRRFEEENIRIDGTDEEKFLEYVKISATNQETLTKRSLDLFSQVSKGEITLGSFVKKLNKLGGLPLELVDQIWKPDLITNQKFDESVSQYLLLFLKTSKLGEVANFLKHLPNNSIPRDAICEFITEVPTGSEEIDSDLVLAACKNDAADFASLYATKSSDIKLALFTCSYKGVNLKLRAAVIDRCIQILNIQNHESSAAALQCLVGMCELKRISLKSLSVFMKSENKSLKNAALLAVVELAKENLIDKNIFDCLIEENIEDWPLAASALILSCQERMFSERIVEKFQEYLKNQLETKINENSLKILMAAAQIDELKPKIKEILEKCTMESNLVDMKQKLLNIL